ncbi:MAG: OmpA family protein [Saprospiraceae bacterium]|nr:OmpA family protein [Saprospiraceae bacterium]
MRKSTITLFLCCVLFAAYSQENQSRHSIGAKLLFIDYGRVNSIDSLNITNGLELLYSYRIGNYINLTVPLKVGVANVVGDINNRNITSIDGIIRANFLKPDSKIIPYAFGGAGIVAEKNGNSNLQIPGGLGLDFRVGSNTYVNLQGEYRYSMEENRNNLQFGAGFIYRLGKIQLDTDKDGVIDTEDECSDVPGLKALKGCPDRDGDGVADKDDQCPDEKGKVETDGCPDTDGDGFANNKDDCPTIPGTLKGCPDGDKDGIADKDDQCPDEAGNTATRGCPDRDNDSVADRFDNCPDEAGLPANNGCPVQDTDRDGIPDVSDKCPTEAGTTATMGCPDRDGDGVTDKDDRCPDAAGPYAGCPDTDGDGVIDADDACPNEAGLASNKGCPELKQEVKEVLEFAMLAVQFETGRAAIKAESYSVLDQIVNIMKQYPVYSLRISGHTDNTGSDSNNQILSEQRAKSCYEYLAASGIAAERMSYAGFGESRPIADNNTAEGKRLNRRTEFELYIK